MRTRCQQNSWGTTGRITHKGFTRSPSRNHFITKPPFLRQWQPVKFFLNGLPNLLAEARQSLGDYVNAGRDDVVYVPNATFAINVIARSLNLGPNDEVLATDHEYGACDRVWRFLSRKRGFSYVRQSISFPVESRESIVDQFCQGVTSKTKVVFLSHITSSTATRLPVKEICQSAKQRGILTIIDGAHAPGQIPIDMEAISADFYFGNAHKWMCSPKGAGFLFTRPEKQQLIEPLPDRLFVDPLLSRYHVSGVRQRSLQYAIGS